MISLLRFIRPLAIVLSGFLAGILFNFLFLRLVIDKTDEFCDFPPSSSILNAQNPSSDVDYVPIMVKKDEKPIKVIKSVKFERPRFYADELGVKEKLIIAVLSSKGSSNFEPFNRTIAHYASKVVYLSPDQSIINNFLQKSNQSMSLVFSHPKTVNFFALSEFVYRKYAPKFDWLFLIDDRTYLKSFRLMDFVSRLWSPNYAILMGNEKCRLSAGGLLISTSAASTIGRRFCRINANLADLPDFQFLECLKMENLKCSSFWKERSLKSVKFSQEIYQSDNLLTNAALSIYDLPSSDEIYRLHQHFCALEMEEIQKSILGIEKELSINPALEIPRSWPASLFPSPIPKNRFDILTWDYFTVDQIYEANKEVNLVRNLYADEKRDIENGLNAISGGKNLELIDGYRRFDPNRGLDYIFNVIIGEASNQAYSIRRFRLVKPLTRAELSPTPFATESPIVHVILPIVITNQSEATLTSSFDRLSSFLTNYEANNLAQRGEKVRLSILIGYFAENARLFFQPIRTRVEFLKRKFPAADVEFSEAFVRNSQNPVLELIYSNLDLPDDELCLIVNDHVRFDREFLNRVRLNTLPGYQIFSPIPFVNFKVKTTVTAPKEYSKISKHEGRFDPSDFSVHSFYWSDLKSNWQNHQPQEFLYVLDLFLQYSPHMKVLRYAEPSLISDFSIKDCSQYRRDYETCQYSNKANFASKKYYESLITYM